MTKYEALVEGDWVELCSNFWELLTGTLLDTRTSLERLSPSKFG